ncbi:hypothetical protein POM88_000819 [Heracleum sosnowskyi]|uniref:Oberon-like PHD finger domain-containing protein n=1 Tax=Heracleum sosnowskyi TaxID=360622 RepID=A0AAD8JBU7_9APIA|nr:hypothetical protein POM88_000819 [Heracleum sosnowskyi]
MSLNTHLYILWNAEHSWSGSQHETSGCKAGNKLCSSLIEPGKPPSGTMFCEICCSEPGFCRSCCCILCSMTVDPANESYSFIRCEATVENKTTCGHLAHLDCGLKSHMAGTVGGRVCLDVEYYCRRSGMACNINENHALKVDEEYVDMGLGSPKKVSENFDPVVESIKFDHHVDQTLQAFKKTQEWENW